MGEIGLRLIRVGMSHGFNRRFFIKKYLFAFILKRGRKS
jgi:hypothetical protein